MTSGVLAATHIGNIPDRRARFYHVLKHLYASKERWDLAIVDLPANLRARARENGCDLRNLSVTWFDVCEDCQIHVLADHDCFYEPAYASALLTAMRSERHGHASNSEDFVGDNGVYVVVTSNRAHGPHVSTAYRVEPKGVAPGQATAADFFLAAERKLRDKTNYGEDAQ
jgi:hypothetical protein